MIYYAFKHSPRTWGPKQDEASELTNSDASPEKNDSAENSNEEVI